MLLSQRSWRPLLLRQSTSPRTAGDRTDGRGMLSLEPPVKVEERRRSHAIWRQTAWGAPSTMRCRCALREAPRGETSHVGSILVCSCAARRAALPPLPRPSARASRASPSAQWTPNGRLRAWHPASPLAVACGLRSAVASRELWADGAQAQVESSSGVQRPSAAACQRARGVERQAASG